MKTLELYYPTKPFIVTQKWGESNDAYKRFGFSKHNGVDFKVDGDKRVKAMCDGIVTLTGNIPDGAGIFLNYRTLDTVIAEGVECYVEFIYMHADRLLVQKGDRIRLGQDIIVADNTGFSTGEHTHISACRLDKTTRERIDTDPEVSRTFDFSKYFNGLYADDFSKTPEFRIDIYYNDHGDGIVNLQNALKKLGYFPFDQESTGFYGEITRNAVYHFQLDHVSLTPWESLFIKGKIFGPKTRKALNELLAKVENNV